MTAALKGRIAKIEIWPLIRAWRDAQTSRYQIECKELCAELVQGFRQWAAQRIPVSDLEVLRRYGKTVQITGMNFRIYSESSQWWDTCLGLKFPEGESVEHVGECGLFGGYREYFSLYVGGPPKGDAERIKAIEPIAYRALDIRNAFQQSEQELRSFLDSRPLRREVVRLYPELMKEQVPC